ncbi:MAG: flagellar hook-length control protein FliK [Candidatus Saganbacteria bacterium]|nr:flagellar hook-length control protein FliK [Candidatus Saganbacteria bacterium]
MNDPKIMTNQAFEHSISDAVSYRSPVITDHPPDFDKNLKDSQKKIDEKKETPDELSDITSFLPIGYVSAMFNLSFDRDRLSDSFKNDLDDNGFLSNYAARPSAKTSFVENNARNLQGQDKDISNGDKSKYSGRAVEDLQQIMQKNRNSLLSANMIPFNEFIRNIEKFSARIDIQSIIDKIVETIKLVKSGEKTELVLDLKPEWLGNMTLNISSDKGVLTVQIFAGENAKSLLDANIKKLQEALKTANLNIGSLSVSVNSQQNRETPSKDQDSVKNILSAGGLEKNTVSAGNSFDLNNSYFQLALLLNKGDSMVYNQI